MKRNRRLALVLGAALLTLSGCEGTKDGTIDYIDGHWVFTDARNEQSMDVTQLLASPDAFYAAASAMSDEELRACFELLTSGQSAELFWNLGEERAMALASRLTQPQVERLLAALEGQERVQRLSDPTELAAVWQTLTTEEQLMALSGLSSEDYAALWALLDGTVPTPEPEPVQPETTDMTDPVYLAGIWYTLSQQEQSDVLSGLSSAQFVALWSLLDEQGGAANGEQAADAPATAESAGEASAPPASEGGMAGVEQMPAPQMTATQTPEPQESAPAQEPEAAASTAPGGENDAGAKDPEALADAWYMLSPEEQLSAVTALTAEQFGTLQELLSTRPKPTPAEEDELFIPTPKPTARRTPGPTPTPTTPPDEAGAGTAEPDLTDPAVLAGLWHTLSPQEQLSILSRLTIEQYIALQELLAQMPDGVTEDAEQAGDEKPGEKPVEPDAADGDDAVLDEEKPGEEPEEPDAADGDDAVLDEEKPGEEPDEPDETADDLTVPEDGAALLPDASDRLLPDLVVRPGGDATPSEALPGQADTLREPLAALSMILKNAEP